jgi:hypothetical protein
MRAKVTLLLPFRGSAVTVRVTLQPAKFRRL